MFFWFGFPFLFLLPLFVAAVAVRAGSSMYRHWDMQDRRGLGGRWPEGGDLLTDIYGVNRGGRSLEARVYQLAAKHKGRITVSDAVIDLGLDVKDAEELLQSLVDNVRVRMELDDNGRVTYEFPEIIDRYERDG
ncbi:MAG: hypothetical protein ACLFRR_00195 [Spirochaetaceae bacterium]